MSKSIQLYKSEAFNVLDSKGKIRTNLLKKYLPNSIDSIRFYHFTGKIANLPIIGSFVKKGLYLYYRLIHTNSLVFPLHEMEKAIETAVDIYVDPCPCRVIAEEDACDAPLYTCMRINHTATVRKEMKDSKGLSKEDALGILRNSYQKGLILSLESCVQPYANNICMCCSCCCIAMKMRYDYGVPIFNSGPYIPVSNPEKCTSCQSCVNNCPVKAITVTENKMEVNLDNCLGCGLCSNSCEPNAIEMIFDENRVRKEAEPSGFRLFLYLVYIYSMMIPSVMLYKIVNGSKKQNMINAKPNLNDYFNEKMQ